jgi:S-adenosylmethionine decarboxylase
LAKGKHLLIDCRNVPRETCLDDRRVLNAMASAAERAGATVISQVRYRFGADSAPGFTAMVLLDESHCSAHSYADLGLIALDVFTCGNTDPKDVLAYLREELELGDITVHECARFFEAGEAPIRELREVACGSTDTPRLAQEPAAV